MNEESMFHAEARRAKDHPEIALGEILLDLKLTPDVANLDDEVRQAFAQFLLEVRTLNAQARVEEIEFTRPFIEAGLLTEETFDGLSFEQVRALIWQARQRLPRTDPLRRVRIPRRNPSPFEYEKSADHHSR